METKMMENGGLPVVNVVFNGEPQADGKHYAVVELRVGEAEKHLNEVEPDTLEIETTLEGVKEYLRTHEVNFSDSFISVNRDRRSICLITDNSNPRKKVEVQGKLQLNPVLEQFGINCPNKVWEPEQLGMFIKMNKAYFADKNKCMELVGKLMNFEGMVNQQVQKSVVENGGRTDNFIQVVDSNLPPAFGLRMPIFKGAEAEDFEVEIFASVNGRTVAFILLSPAIKEVVDTTKDPAINRELSAIRETYPELCVFEV